MTDQKGFPSDEERLEAIERSGKRMQGPEGVDFDQLQEKIMENCEPIFKGQVAFSRFMKQIFEQAHQEMGWWKKHKLLRSLFTTYLMWQHIQECEDCKPVLREALRQVEIFSQMTLIPPRIVTLEDGEKALEYLAQINKMSKEDFRKWMHDISDRVIKEMNNPKTD